MSYHFSCVMAQLFTDQSVYCYISNFAFITRVEFTYKASRFQHKLWEKHDITGPPIITYICVCVGEVMHPVYTFLNGPSVIEHIPN
jgi:hypothetical protein